MIAYFLRPKVTSQTSLPSFEILMSNESVLFWRVVNWPPCVFCTDIGVLGQPFLGSPVPTPS